MASIAELYPSRYLSAADLHGREVTVTIERAAVEGLRNPRTHQEEPKLVLYFLRARKCMPCNKTQARAIATWAGDDTDAWPGATVTLSPARAPNGADTIACARPLGRGTPPAADGQPAS